MTRAEERRALQKIYDGKHIHKVVEPESSRTDSDPIDEEHAAIEKLQKQLANLQVEAYSERYYTLEAKIDVMKREVDLFGNPSLLFEQQRKLQQRINTLFSERYDLISRLRKDDTDYYYAMIDQGFLHTHTHDAGWWSATRESEVGEKAARSYLSSHYRCRPRHRLGSRSTTCKS